MIKFIDLCCGIGGFRQAFENVGFQCVFSCEKDKYCKETYFNNYNEMPFDDLTKLDVSTIPQYDVLLAGFPCQAFSISGKQNGFNDIRGTIFFYIANIIKETSPKIILMENVKNLIYHNYGSTFKVILETLSNLGYFVDYRILNAKDYGIPQNRERIYIIATKDKILSQQLLDIQKEYTRPLNQYLKDIDDKYEILNPSEYQLLTNTKIQKSGLIFKGYLLKNIRNGIKNINLNLSRVHKQPNRIYDNNGFAPTLMAQEVGGRYYIFDNTINKVRKLTLKECYHLMGFPKSFKFHKSKTQAFKQIGNSVVIPIIQKIALNIKNML